MKNDDKARVYIILAIFNEEENLRDLIMSIRNAFGDMPYKIIAVDDGSYDKSYEILKEINDDDIEIESHKINLNIGAVFSTGINRAANLCKEKDVVIIMEADKTSNPSMMKSLVRKITEEKYDICISSRYIGHGGYKNFPWLRHIYSYAANSLLGKLFPIPGVSDYTIFFRAYSGRIIKNMIEFFGPYNFIQTKGFVSNAEILIKMALLTDKITEAPFIYDYGVKKGRSKMNVLKTIFEYFIFIYDMKILIKKVSRVRGKL